MLRCLAKDSEQRARAEELFHKVRILTFQVTDRIQAHLRAHALLPWDHAPGVLLHREAGGFGRQLDGTAYTPLVHQGGLLLTPDEASWTTLRDVLLG